MLLSLKTRKEYYNTSNEKRLFCCHKLLIRGIYTEAKMPG